MFKLLRKGNEQLTFGRILLKDTRSRLVPEVEVNAFLRQIFVVWVTRVVCDMDKGTTCEFGNARWSR